MIRWLFNLAAASSLLLCITTALLWARSHFNYDIFVFQRNRQYSATSDHGCLSFIVCKRYGVTVSSHPPFPDDKAWPFSGNWQKTWQAGSTGNVPTQSIPWALHAGDWWEPLDQDLGMMDAEAGFEVVVRDWLLVALLAIVPALWLRKMWKVKRHDRRLRDRCCPSCGYDLRATTERCPECGTLKQNTIA